MDGPMRTYLLIVLSYTTNNMFLCMQRFHINVEQYHGKSLGQST
jgi:hypothetical protein